MVVRTAIQWDLLCLFLWKDSEGERKTRERSIFHRLEQVKLTKERMRHMGPTFKPTLYVTVGDIHKFWKENK